MHTWQSILKNLITDPAVLINLLELDPVWLPQATTAAKLFPLRVSPSFVEKMKKGDIHDPLLRQVLPLGDELLSTPGFTEDPLLEKAKTPIPGLLHKYHGRVLLTLTGACAVHCRYCFRRHFPYSENNPGKQGWDRAFAYISNDPSISEIILSGGDPLILPDDYLAELILKMAEIPHVKLLRVHTRLPIMIPERITQALSTLLTATRLKPIVVIHANHPNELDAVFLGALNRLTQAGVVLLNQSVLLKGVNDSVEILEALSRRLFEGGVLPYYLHCLDRVQGTAHFEIAEEKAKRLHAALHLRLPGYLLPRLVREVAGEGGKRAVEKMAV